MLTQAPKGTKDILPSEVYKWQYIENVIRDICSLYGYKEIRTPIFEHTELFERGVGDTTDIVQKEMYTFNDKGGRSLTLKPEGTSPAVRAFIEHGLFNEPQPTKLYYLTPCFRYENTQSGRQRQFHQFGIEAFGAADASIDAEVISIVMRLFERLGVSNLELNINSVGCTKCRENYSEKLKNFLKPKFEYLCNTCKDRYNRNPLRIIDCKEEKCKELIKGIPYMIDSLCPECEEHFESLKENLGILGLKYKIDPQIVRGLDYYTKTAFEIVSNDIGAQGTVCGGGRYDGLIAECGGPETPGVGFGLGIERLLLVMNNQKITIPKDNNFDIYIANIGDTPKKFICELVDLLRNNGIKAEKDYMNKSLKAQMKFANKIGAKFVAIIGDEELSKREAKIKNMETGLEEYIEFDKIIQYIKTL